jgi:hypothetical protein
MFPANSRRGGRQDNRGLTETDEARGVGAQFGVRACLVEAREYRKLLSLSALIDFQPAGAPVPTGYLADTGAAFGPRGGGLSFPSQLQPSVNP